MTVSRLVALPPLSFSLALSTRRRGCNRGVSFKDPSLVSIDEEFRSRDRERLAAEGKRPEERRREGEGLSSSVVSASRS